MKNNNKGKVQVKVRVQNVLWVPRLDTFQWRLKSCVRFSLELLVTDLPS